MAAYNNSPSELNILIQKINADIDSIHDVESLIDVYNIKFKPSLLAIIYFYLDKIYNKFITIYVPSQKLSWGEAAYDDFLADLDKLRQKMGKCIQDSGYHKRQTHRNRRTRKK